MEDTEDTEQERKLPVIQIVPRPATQALELLTTPAEYLSEKSAGEAHLEQLT